MKEEISQRRPRGEDLSLGRKPAWIRQRLPSGPAYGRVLEMMRSKKLHTICEDAKCPNLGECWSRGTATFLILGNVCTRACGFCSVATGIPGRVDRDEPRRVAEAIKGMNLKFAVITSVDRDDLADGGASIWAETITQIRNISPGTGIEVLIPDFAGNWEALGEVMAASPDVLAHNLETVPALYRTVRARSEYSRSLELLSRARTAGMRAKTGIMLGIGETEDEIRELIRDVAEIGVEILTIGQYLKPTKNQLPVLRWVLPEEFQNWKEFGESIGIEHVESGPLVRSSYHAESHAGTELFEPSKIKKDEFLDVAVDNTSVGSLPLAGRL